MIAPGQRTYCLRARVSVPIDHQSKRVLTVYECVWNERGCGGKRTRNVEEEKNEAMRCGMNKEQKQGISKRQSFR